MLGGELVHQTSDEYGSIEVIDYMQQFRSLHFGNATQQSASLLCNPYFLVHKYAQAMTLPLCWLKAQRVLVLGLGAGSIVKYLYNYFPDLIIDAVELRPKVTDVAIEYFLLPEPDKRFNVYHGAAEEWLLKKAHCQYDLIIVDVFMTSNSGKDITIDISNAFSKISQLLTESGVAVFNYLGPDALSYPGYDDLCQFFKQPIKYIDVESTNSIILASKSPIPDQITESDHKRISEICTIDYANYLSLMKPMATL